MKTPPFEGDVYQATELPRVPRTLAKATSQFAKSDFIADVLGAPVREHYAQFFRAERDAYEKAVTDWERVRYFEQI